VCTTGKFVAVGEMPPPLTYETFRCANPVVCEETRSVIDMMPTVTAKNCATGGSKFEKGACPTENVVGRCRSASSEEDTVAIIYPPRTTEEARAICTQFEGTFVEK
jgi:hypothetical protein